MCEYQHEEFLFLTNAEYKAKNIKETKTFE